MSFASIEFLVFFAAVLFGLRVMPTRDAKFTFLLFANLLFYAAGTPWFVIVLLVPSIVDYACAIRIEDSEVAATRRAWLTLSLVTTLGILCYFKYANFFGDAVAAVLGVTPGPLMVALPIGISFFTFKTMSYTIDVYRRRIPACRSLRDYTMFVSFFPELVAGPIVRASVFLPQLTRSLGPTMERSAVGVPMILLGFTKKLLIADRLALFVDGVYRRPELFSQGTVVTATIAYSLQIYCDFSGYTDIAIGVAKVIGIDLPENFNMPYLARSITDFWRRWHITLSQWLRDYLYIPLGGNRRGEARMYVNLMVTMLLGGLWHGARWTFVVWGGLHGLGLVAHKLWARYVPATSVSAGMIGRLVGWTLTYAFVCLTWVFFRAPTLSAAMLTLQKMLGQAPGGIGWFYLPFWILLPIVVAGHVMGVIRARPRTSASTIGGGVGDGAEEARSPTVWSAAPTPALTLGFRTAFVVTLWAVVVYLFMPVQVSPFIYFRF